MSTIKRRKVPKIIEKPDKTSIRNDYVLCDYCGKKEKSKQTLRIHIKDCVSNRTCSLCNIVFTNRGNLYSHSLHLHGKEIRTSSTNSSKYLCTVCPKSYTQITNLKYHIRKDHFNMQARVIEGETRDINAVWVERVQNSEALIEITKTGPNTYLMKKTTHTEALVHECTDTIDLSLLYPTHPNIQRVYCSICKKTIYKRFYKKHMNEKHKNLKQFKCNNCNKDFKRTYQYLKHICKTQPGRKRKNVTGTETKDVKTASDNKVIYVI